MDAEIRMEKERGTNLESGRIELKKNSIGKSSGSEQVPGEQLLMEQEGSSYVLCQEYKVNPWNILMIFSSDH